MTTPAITDEQIADIEALATGGNVPRWGSMVMCCGTVLDLICRLRAAERDAARYRWVRESSYVELYCNSPRLKGWIPEHLDAAIDAAMAKPEPNPPA